MVSVHRFPGEKGNIKKKKLDLNNKEIIDIEYELSRSAIINSEFDILGHPFGMSLKRFKIIQNKEKSRCSDPKKRKFTFKNSSFSFKRYFRTRQRF